MSKIEVQEFAKKNSFSGSDLRIVSKVYSGQERTEEEWFDELKDKIDFNTEKFIKLKKIQEKKSSNKSKDKN